ncbi:response regulator [Puteibacter caeruleilacunae]|nr:response regulator [Puteibacter caeruleilacunae]
MIRLFVVILFILFGGISSNADSGIPVTVSRIGYEQGLSENTVNCILQDSLGFIWIGTREGVNRYDGNSCVSYYAESGSMHGLRSSVINDLFLGVKQQVWINTTRGVDVYDPVTNSFERLELKIEKPNLTVDHVWDIAHTGGISWLSGSYGFIGLDSYACKSVFYSKEYAWINNLFVESDNVIWCNSDQGILRFDVESKTFEKVIAIRESINSLVRFNRFLWLGTRQGLIVVDVETTKRITPEQAFREMNISIGDDFFWLNDVLITDISTVGQKELWIASDGNGLLQVDLKNNTTQQFKESKLHTGLSANAIRKVFIDRDENIWIGTVHKGVNLIRRNRKQFYSPEFEDEQLNFSTGNVSNFAYDSNNNLWCATFDGLCRLNKQTLAVEKVVAPGTVINAIAIDKNDIVWIGTFQHGLLTYDIRTGKLSPFKHPSYDLSTSYMGGLACDQEGAVWIGSGTLYRYHNGSMEQCDWAVESPVNCIIVDRAGNIWLGTSSGVNKIDRKTQKVSRYKRENEEHFTLSGNRVNSLFEDRKGNIWVGTDGSGLNCIVEGKSQCLAYGKKDGLPSDVIRGICEGDDGNIWFTTNKGLVRMDSETSSFNVFDFTDGLVNNQYIDESIFNDSNGRILCGGEVGIDYFYPQKIVPLSVLPNVVINGFFYDDKPVVFEEREGIISRIINNMDTLEFKHNESYFSFGFTGIEYTNPNKITYAYKLDGFDDDWKNVSHRQIINYIGVPPGAYEFKVKASNSDKVWNEDVASVRVIVYPSFWQTPWAFLAYALAGGLLVFGIYRYQLNRKLLHNRLVFESRERKRIEELNQLKLRFFTHVSHELRTPLSLIIAPVKELLKRSTDGDFHKELSIINANAEKLQVLVNQVLEIRKVEAGAIQLHRQTHDIVSFIRSTTEAFQHWARQRAITLEFASDIESLNFSFDRELIEKVMYNLLSNAMKYTHYQGSVKVSVVKEDDFCKIAIDDTGIGIDEEDQEKLFDMFFQVNGNANSSGVGLALCKELVELHGGSIHVTSKAGKGSCFSFLIPLHEEEDVPLAKAKEIEIEHAQRRGDKHIMVVEDQPELNRYLAEKLAKHYHVITAENGKDALDKLASFHPHLIISDVMMPEMDGWQLCDTIKTQVETSHIPIVLLTALGDTKDKIEGLSVGADAYLTKPFDLDHLIAQIENILENRDRFRDRFEKEPIELVSQEIPNALDQEFLQQSRDVILKHLTNPDFTVQLMADELSMSRVNLHLKLKGLCEMSATEFISKIRLEEALVLLKKGTSRMGEIADLTGFSSPSHFSRVFKKSFGMTPSEYLKK